LHNIEVENNLNNLRQDSFKDDNTLVVLYEEVNYWFSKQDPTWARNVLSHGDAHGGNALYNDGKTILVDFDKMVIAPKWWDITEILVSDGDAFVPDNIKTQYLRILKLPPLPKEILANLAEIRLKLIEKETSK
jgi:aminoglycoside phosphotransferase (APT) family kinase protein